MASKIPAGEFNTRVSLDGTGPEKTLKQLRNAVSTLTSEWKSQVSELKRVGDQYGAAKVKFEGLSKAVDAQKQAVDKLKSDYSKLDTSTNAGAEAQSKMARQVAQAENKLASLTRQQESARKSMELYKTGVIAAREKLEQMQSTSKAYVDRLNAEGKANTANAQKLKDLKAQHEQMKTVYQKEVDILSKVATESGKDSEAYAKQATAVNKLGSDLASSRSEISRLSNSSAVLGTRFNSVKDASSKLGSTAKSAFGELKGAVTTASVAVAGVGAALLDGAKQASSLQKTYTETNNLLVTGGEKEAEAQKAVNRMRQDGSKYSMEYGKSQQSIAEGYQDLIKRGYSSKEAIGAMKTELQASVASGDDFKDVITVASQTLESFGMRSNNAAKMTHNTKVAVNELAYAADTTATDFSSLGKGMEYVGATAKNSHISLATTAAALGELSNRGLEADKAGTGLRKVIVSLASPTSAAADALKTIGLNTKSFTDQKGNLKSFTDIMQILRDHTEKLGSGQKAAVFKAIFGTTGMQAAQILTENASDLDKLSSKVRKAGEDGDYVAKLADKNNASAQQSIARFKQSYNNLEIMLASKLLPVLSDTADKMTKALAKPEVKKEVEQLSSAIAGVVKKLADGVGWMLDHQGTVVNFAKAIAAIWAVDKAAKAINAVHTIYSAAKDIASIKNIDLGAKFFGKTSAAKVASDITGIGTAATEAGASAEAGAATASGGLSGLAAAASAAGISIPVVGVALAATAAAATGAYVWYEKVGKSMIASKERADTWGSDIGAVADKSATKFQQFSTTASAALDGVGTSAKGQAKQVKDAFADMVSTTKQAADDQETAAEKLQKQFAGTAAGKVLEQGVKDQKAANEKSLKQMDDYYSQIQTITKNASDNHRKLTAEESTEVHNIQVKMASAELDVLNVSNKNKKAMMAAMTGDISNMSEKQLTRLNDSLTKAAQSENKTYNKQMSELKTAYKNGTIDYETYHKTKDQIQKTYQNKMSAQEEAFAKEELVMEQKYGISRKATLKDLESTYNLTEKQAKALVSSVQSSSKKLGSVTVAMTSSMSSAVKKAANAWNGMKLVDKNGKVKTNATQTVATAIKSGKQWNNIKLLLKNGKLSTNAKSVVAQALVQNKSWNKLKFFSRYAGLTSNVKATVAEGVTKNKQWNKLNFKQMSLITYNKTNAAVIQAMKNVGSWNKLSSKQKNMIANAKTNSALKTALSHMGQWNRVKSELKKMSATDKSSSASKAAVSALNNFNRKSTPEKHLSARYSQSGNPSGTLNNMSSFESHRNKTVTYTTVYKTKGRASGGGLFSGWFAQGTNDAPSGTVMVNDGPGANFREAIEHNGQVAIPFGRNVITRVPAHAKILTASQTIAKYGAIPQFASGTLDTPVNTALANVPTFTATNSGVQNTVNLAIGSSTDKLNNSITDFNADSKTMLKYQDKQLTMLQQQNNLLMQMLRLLASADGGTGNAGAAMRTLMQGMATVSGQINRGRMT